MSYWDKDIVFVALDKQFIVAKYLKSYYVRLISPEIGKTDSRGAIITAPLGSRHYKLDRAVAAIEKLRESVNRCELCDHYSGYDLVDGLCTECHYWLTIEKTNFWKHVSGTTIFADGACYEIEHEGIKTDRRELLGFGGQVFHIRLPDGREVVTNSLWHRGTIPERFRKLYPDNAIVQHEPFDSKEGAA